MAEYIDKELLIRVLKNREDCVDCTDTDYVDCMCDFIACIFPSDVAEVRRGKWERKENTKVYWYACSLCGEKVPRNEYGYDYFSDYCPNCGAKMDLGDDEE